MNTLNKKLLILGCVQTLTMAIYHFFIPFQFQWAEFLSDNIPTINWSLYSLNNYFSFNLLILSMFLLYHLVKKTEKLHTIKILATIILLFWLFSLAYQVVAPMPLPDRMQWIRLLLFAIAAINIFVFIIPLKKLISTKT